nr:protein little zipper 2 [Quercus suber]
MFLNTSANQYIAKNSNILQGAYLCIVSTIMILSLGFLGIFIIAGSKLSLSPSLFIVESKYLFLKSGNEVSKKKPRCSLTLRLSHAIPCLLVFDIQGCQRDNLRVRRLNRRRRVLKEKAKEKKRVRVMKMETKNLKLFMVNQSIIEENEKLRQKGLLLHQENQALLFQLQTKLS